MPKGSGLYSADNLALMRENARMASLRRLGQLPMYDEELAFELEFLVEFGFPTEKILQVASDLKVDFIIMGLHRSTHIGTVSHTWTIAYEVVCGAGCPVLTVRR
jgi:nucleotide-binding universal stress UspA family protein